MTEDYLTEYLIKKAGGKLVMTPAQLAEEIGVSAKQQSKLRQDNRFPIPHQKLGSSVRYPIPAVVDFLLTGKSEQDATPVSKAQKPKAARKVKNTTIVNLSHVFMLQTVIDKIASDAASLTRLSEYLHEYRKRHDLTKLLTQTLK